VSVHLPNAPESPWRAPRWLSAGAIRKSRRSRTHLPTGNGRTSP
jgi:hypothetical protein